MTRRQIGVSYSFQAALGRACSLQSAAQACVAARCRRWRSMLNRTCTPRMASSQTGAELNPSCLLTQVPCNSRTQRDVESCQP